LTTELYGRQYLFFGTYLFLTIFNAGAAGSQNIETLIILRFLAGAFGSSPLTNAGGVIADMFPASQRGLAMVIFAAAPFLGPVIGPIGKFHERPFLSSSERPLVTDTQQLAALLANPSAGAGLKVSWQSLLAFSGSSAHS
jgi:MFS family permease